MKISFDESMRVLVAGILTSALVACGGDSDDNDHEHEEEHDHGSLIISQTGSNSLSLLDEGELTAFEDVLAFTSATFIQSDNGEFAAIEGGSEIQFVSEEGISEHAIMGSEVVATNGHFSILDAGSSTLVAVESLEEVTLVTESTMSLGLTEVYPALVLDELEEIRLVFVSGEARIYEGELDTTEFFSCTNPSSTAQAHHSAIVTCDEGVTLVVFEEDTTGVTYTISSVTLDGSSSEYVWQSTEHVFAGYAPGSANYALVHVEEDLSTETILGSDVSTHALSANICEAGIEQQDEDFLIWLSGGTFVALTNEGALINQIVIDTSTSTACSDYSLAITDKTALAIDNDAMMFYEIDVDEGATVYHVHEDIELLFSDVTDSVILAHEEGEEGGHEDEHGH